MRSGTPVCAKKMVNADSIVIARAKERRGSQGTTEQSEDTETPLGTTSRPGKGVGRPAERVIAILIVYRLSVSFDRP